MSESDKTLRRHLLSSFAGILILYLELAIYFLPHEWSPAGRWATFLIASTYGASATAILYFICFLPMITFLQNRYGVLGLVRSIIFGATLYPIVFYLVSLVSPDGPFAFRDPLIQLFSASVGLVTTVVYNYHQRKFEHYNTELF